MKIALLVLAGISLGGCATVTRGTSEDVAIYVSPEGAEATSSTGHSCERFPCSIEVSRKTEFSVTAKLDGYEPQTVFVRSDVAPGGAAGLAGNILVGGIIGAGVDVASGATLSHLPNPVLIELVPVTPGLPRGDLSAVRRSIEAKQAKQSAAAMRQVGGV
ncbi:translation initiation factor 2 [Roseibium sp.]|uniref:translation initiation factor 2 n=1 Tax=Roseibium sp. TaxID=1936156 RepID=UPI003267ABD6